MTALGLFAAIIPIVGSLFCASSFLTEQAHLHHERRVRYRLSSIIEQRRNEVMARLSAQGGPFGGPVYDAMMQEVTAFENRMLRYNGVEPTRPLIVDFNVSVQMSAPALHGRELRRQWILLASATAGLLLLVADAATT